jgi:uncharacterized protein
MLYTREYIAFVCRHLVAELAKKNLKLGSPEVVNEKVREAVTNEISAEDRLNDEVRVLLDRFAGEMREHGASYAESFKRVKRQLMKERGIVPASGGEAGRISRDKILKLSHVVLNTLLNLRKEAELRADKSDVRMDIVRILTNLFREEEKVDEAVRHKIQSQKRTIPEGSQEWDILYRKYYAEEMKKLGVA